MNEETITEAYERGKRETAAIYNEEIAKVRADVSAMLANAIKDTSAMLANAVKDTEVALETAASTFMEHYAASADRAGLHQFAAPIRAGKEP